jgi:hypothetical protein
MDQNTLRTASRWLTFLVLVLLSAAPAAGLLWDGLYQDIPFVRAAWLGNDLVTLLFAVPLLGIALIRSMSGFPRANLIRLGVLDYALYTYAFYLYAAAFNAFFLVYSLLMTLSLLGLIFGLIEIQPEQVKSLFRERTPVRWIGGYQIFVALGLSAVYLLQAAAFILRGQIPEIILKTNHVTHIVPALDLTFVVPWLLLGGIWIWQRKPWGYVISAVMVVKGVLYMLALTVASFSGVQAGFPESAAEIPLWGTLWLGFVITGIVMLVNSQQGQPHDQQVVEIPADPAQ